MDSLRTAQEYTDTTLLECNRVFSEEYRAGNQSQPALFTNKTTPIHLSAGDQISLHSGYISEVGAGGEVIEITGKKSNNASYSIESTSFTYIDYVDNIGIPYPLGDFKKIKAESVTKSYDIQDNKATISISFYTNLNGNCSIFLPRNWDKQYPLTATQSDYTENWESPDDANMGQVTNMNTWRLMCNADFHMIRIPVPTSQSKLGMFQDCSRMKIYVKDETAYYADDSTSDVLKYFNASSLIPYNPLQYKYIPYKKEIEFELDIGYDTPSNIANTITTTMNKIVNTETLSASKLGDNYIENNYSKVSDSETYKKFFCANEQTFSEPYFGAYYANPRASHVWNASSMGYLAAHTYIGVKRPEFFETGRALFGSNNNGSGFTLRTAITKAGRDTAILQTNYEWDTVIEGRLLLDRINDFFNAQKLYPELLEQANNFGYFGSTANISASNARLLHINGSEISNEVDVGLIGSELTVRNNVNETSRPLFIYFDELNENKYTDGVEDIDLCYGFALNVDGYISFTTSAIDGIPDKLSETEYNLFNAGDEIEVGRPFGYDFHSSAYGNVHVILYSGYLGRNASDIQGSGSNDVVYNGDISTIGTFYYLSPYINYTYLGSNSPLFNFDTVTNRFTWSYLHSPERLGAQFLAGLNASAYVYPDDASNEVYKINPVANGFSFTPDMKPYDVQLREILSVQSFTSNRNFKRWSIIDSNSGIFLESFGSGYSKQSFKETLWSILGFSYDQLYPTNPNNIQNRIDSISNPNMAIITTNADVTSAEIANETVNIFGNQMFTDQIPTILLGSTTNTDAFLNPITVNCESAVIKADNLPKKTTRPYFIVRTSLLGQPTFQGGINSNELFPVIAVVNKINGYSDFFSQDQNQITYTITKPMTITQVTTSIHDPDQKFSSVDDNTSIIYKVIRKKEQPNLAETILQQTIKK